MENSLVKKKIKGSLNFDIQKKIKEHNVGWLHNNLSHSKKKKKAAKRLSVYQSYSSSSLDIGIHKKWHREHARHLTEQAVQVQPPAL